VKKDKEHSMTTAERRATFGLAGIYATRMLGLFLILPVFAVLARDLPDATPLLIGLAIGAYGLTQALLQIPFGMLSDRIGRRPVIVGGLLIFMLGSVVAALADDLVTILIGRAIQGAGAIPAVVTALLADLTRESQRTKSMALIGMSIGASFMLAMILGPLLAPWIGLSGLFWLIFVLACAGIPMLFLVVPAPPAQGHSLDVTPPGLGAVLRDVDLLRLDFGIFVLHAIMTALFLAVPLGLTAAGLAGGHHAWFYLAVLLVSVLGMFPAIARAERQGRHKALFLAAIGLVALALILLAQPGSGLPALAIWLALFFTGFNILEASLPSLVSRTAPGAARGAAMGVYSTAQFAGAFVGGAGGGWVQQQFGAPALYLAAAVLAGLWFLAALGMRVPPRAAAGLDSRSG
jgi:MFS family permease